MAKKYHPDNNTTDNAASMFEMVTESYEVLSNKRKRKHYDELGDAGQRFGATTSGPGRQRSDFDAYTSDDLFDDMFKTSKSDEQMADPISEAFQVWIKSSSQLLRMNIRCIKNEQLQAFISV